MATARRVVLIVCVAAFMGAAISNALVVFATHSPKDVTLVLLDILAAGVGLDALKRKKHPEDSVTNS